MTPREFVLARKAADCFFLSDRPKVGEMTVVPTGNYAIDNLVIGIGGIPSGRITEVYGDASAGKTTLVLHAIAQAQAMGLGAAFVDAEHALDTTYAQALGVDLTELVLSQPECGEEALDFVIEACASEAFGLVVVDSVAALIPRAELDGEMDDAQIGLHARLMSKAMRKVIGAVAKSGTALVFTNQERSGPTKGYGPAKTTTGGLALKFYASLRLDVTNVGQIKEGDQRVGHTAEVVAVKNKLYPPYRKARVDLLYGLGYDNASTLIDLASDYTEAVTKSGNFLTVLGKKCNGRAAAASYVREDEGVATLLEQSITKAIEGEPA